MGLHLDHLRDLGLIVRGLAVHASEHPLLREGRGPVLGRALRIYPACVRASGAFEQKRIGGGERG